MVSVTKSLDWYKIFTKELLEFLGDDFIRAPASTMKSLHNAFPGGLIDHIILTTKYGVDINLSLPENIRVDNSSLIKVCFLHQIGKTFECFKKVKFIVYAEDNWTLPKQWKYSNVSLDKISNLV